MCRFWRRALVVHIAFAAHIVRLTCVVHRASSIVKLAWASCVLHRAHFSVCNKRVLVVQAVVSSNENTCTHDVLTGVLNKMRRGVMMMMMMIIMMVMMMVMMMMVV